MDNACATLFYALDREDITPSARTLFLNGQYHPNLKNIPDVTIQQHFKPYADTLSRQGFSSTPTLPDQNNFDTVMVLASKQDQETRISIATALSVLKPDGILICAGDNKAGGKRLSKIMTTFGLDDPQHVSKYKARCVWGCAHTPDFQEIKTHLDKNKIHTVSNTNLISQPGVFGWQKIDTGSALLTKHLPTNLRGHGADFGCGYGYLSDHVLKTYPAIKSLACVDADYRAVELCRQNLQDYETPCDYLWADLTQTQTTLKNLDFIIMNPPFHEGSQTDSTIGQAFIKTAAAALKSGGHLWMVANSHLPYETVLHDMFKTHNMPAQDKGFKILNAIK